jgi:hypothetical protein
MVMAENMAPDAAPNMEYLFARQGTALSPVGGVEVDQLPAVNTALTRIERFWADHIRFRM